MKECLSIDNCLNFVMSDLQHVMDNKLPISGLPTGFYDFDELTGGLHPGELILIGGRPSMGKSLFALSISQFFFMKMNNPVLIFNMESSPKDLTLRILSSLTRIDSYFFRSARLSDECWSKISIAVSFLSNKPLFIDTRCGLTPEEIEKTAMKVSEEKGQLGLIVVDYIQLMTVESQYQHSRAVQIGEITRSLKSFALKMKVPIIAISQINRECELRADKRPVLSDFRDSGSIEEDADMVIFIYRDEVYNDNSRDKETAEIIVAKHRNGPIGKIRLNFSPKYCSFENYIRP